MKEVTSSLTETVKNAGLFAVVGAGIAWGLHYLKTAIPASVLGIMIPGAQIGLIAAGVLGTISLIGALTKAA